MKKCAWVENMISIETDGFTRACCGEISPHARISPITNGILNSFNSPRLIKLKEELEKGFSTSTQPFCNRCEYLEKNNQPSLRTKTKFLSNARELKMIQFKLSNKCQLACFHCGPSQSSTWAKKINVSPRIKKSFSLNDEFLVELSELLPNLEVIKFTGGEPFLDPDHWAILEYLKKFNRSHCELQYITNGVSPFKESLWSGWKSVNCSVSVDGFEETYEWFRRGAKWNNVVQGVNKLKDHANIEINYSLTPFTIDSFLKAKEFWKYKFSAVPIVYPSYASLSNFPSTIVERIDNFKMIPYSAYSDNYNIEEYAAWANKWDNMWNTPGWSEKLYWWIKEFNDRN